MKKYLLSFLLLFIIATPALAYELPHPLPYAGYDSALVGLANGSGEQTTVYFNAQPDYPRLRNTGAIYFGAPVSRCVGSSDCDTFEGSFINLGTGFPTGESSAPIYDFSNVSSVIHSPNPPTSWLGEQVQKFELSFETFQTMLDSFSPIVLVLFGIALALLAVTAISIFAERSVKKALLNDPVYQNARRVSAENKRLMDGNGHDFSKH